jgi:N-acylglucosamine 2-epimerase
VNHERLVQLRDFHRTGLLDDVVPFWMRHSVDREAGGFFTFLERDGRVYCTDKPVWLMGRITWLYATLYTHVEPRPEWLELARHGYDFLTRHCFAPGGKLYFRVTREGRPLRMRRYVFSEVFAILGFAALARATGDPQIRQRALDLFQTLVRTLTTPGAITPKFDPQTRPMRALSPSMCLLNVADTLIGLDDHPRYEQIISAAVEDVFRYFARPEDGAVLETVGPNGERLDTPEGRTMNPGHAIEVAWFIMEIGRRRGDMALVQRAARILDWSFERGWDKQYGGLLYFVDVEDKPSPYLEHDMKLWWPHSEALYAALFAYHLLGDEKYARMYEQLHEWTYAHFPDPEFGEWYAYFHRDGSPATTLKGNLWKGPFHIPRTQLYCWKLLDEMLASPR